MISRFEDNLKMLQWKGELIGEEKGLKRGMSIGENEGKNKKAMEIAKRLLLKDMPLEEVGEITGLSLEDLEALIACPQYTSAKVKSHPPKNG